MSLSWMTAVSLVPPQDRPYVDGSPDDSVYTQVFDYNGLGRLTGNWASVAGPPSPLVVAAKENGRLLNAETIGIKASWHRLLADPFAAGSGWLLPAAVAGALGVLISRRRQGRRDPLRAAAVLWGGWWLVLAVFFSVGKFINSYYVAALVPAVAALCGTGIAACGPGPWPARVRLIVTGTVLGCVGYGAYLMSGTVSGPVVLTVVALIVAAAAAAQLLLPASGRAGHLTAVAFAGAAVLLLPAAASVSCVIGGLGPFDTPFESSKTAHNNQQLAADAPALTRAVQRLELETPPGDALFGTDTSGLAQSYILYSGREVLPPEFIASIRAPARRARGQNPRRGRTTEDGKPALPGSAGRDQDRGQVGQPLVQVADVEQVAQVGKVLIEDPDPAAVLRRPIPAPAGAARVGHSRLGRDDLLHNDVVPPVVAEVVAVHHLRPLGPGHLGERGGGLVLPFSPVVILVRRAELTAHRLEGVQVIVVPVEGDLQDRVHEVQRHRAGNLKPPPDRRLRAVQAHLDPVHGSDGIRRQFGQFLPRDALAANERLLLEATQHLLLQRLDRVSR